MPVLRNIGVLARCLPGGGRHELHEIRNAAVAWDDGVISWIGNETLLPEQFKGHEALDAGGRLVVPGLVDCHTHLAFGGWRSDEFVERIKGTSYLEIAARGGGIQRTVAQTRGCSVRELADRCRLFLDEMLDLGITTVEAKSGYGLSLEDELKQLEAYRLVSDRHPIRLVPTVLAHTVPSESAGRRGEYLDMISEELLPAVSSSNLARFCDVFVEDGAFSPAEGRRILEKARDLGFGLKIHADQLSDLAGAALAAELGAASADHLECISDESISAMAGSGTVAVALPLATLYLGTNPMPARRLIDAGVPVAVATDFNPGSAPSYHLPFAMTLACLMLKMTPAEVLKGATIFAAQAIGLDEDVGSVEVGKSADLVVIDAEGVAHWLYHVRPNAATTVILRGHAQAAGS